MTPSQRTLGRGKRAVLAALLAIVAACLLEGGYRTYLLCAGLPQSPAALRREIDRVVSLLTERIPRPEERRTAPAEPATADFVHPYFGFERHQAAAQLVEEVARLVPETSHVFNVLVLGGSVAGRFCGYRQAFVARLEADPRLGGRHVQVHGFARGAFKQPQQTTMLAYLFGLGVRPDVVLNLDGFNEVAIGLDNGLLGVSPLYPMAGAWSRVANPASFDPKLLDLALELREQQNGVRTWALLVDRLRLDCSAVAARVVLSDLRRRQRRYALLYQQYVGRTVVVTAGGGVAGPPFDAAPVAILATVVRAWSEGSRSLHGMCAERGIPYLHVLQPTLHDPGAKPMTAEERAKGHATPAWIEGVRAGYPLLRAGCAELARQGVPCVDLSRVFADVDETLYFDACHFNERGHDLLGAAVAEAMLESLFP